MSKHVFSWLAQEEGAEKILEAYTQLTWLQRELLDEYEPLAYVKFSDRIDGWLENFIDDGDRRAMYQLLPRIFFVGREQIESLSRAAFNDIGCRWIIEQAGINLLDIHLQSRLGAALSSTWFCPVTDSMKINSFLKLNGLGGHAIRPDWLSLAQLGDANRIKAFVLENKIDRIVMVEDFVGSGSQMSEAVEFAADVLPETPKLVVPLICCPAGLQLGSNLASRHTNLSFEPVLSLREEHFVLPEPRAGEPPEFVVARRLSMALSENFGRNWGDPFGHNDTGALVVLHTNCPDNTLPLIHDESPSWTAIFPRISRG